MSYGVATPDYHDHEPGRRLIAIGVHVGICLIGVQRSRRDVMHMIMDPDQEGGWLFSEERCHREGRVGRMIAVTILFSAI